MNFLKSVLITGIFLLLIFFKKQEKIYFQIKIQLEILIYQLYKIKE
jgi:hypothetical protein